jgi:osmotically inducible protein OsmC
VEHRPQRRISSGDGRAFGRTASERAMKTQGSAVWHGGIKDGRGAISTKSGALADAPYGFSSRFEGNPGTNPEELLGAAHAACFTMALSLMLSEEGLTAETLETTAEVTLDKDGEGYAIKSSHLTLRAKVPGVDAATFKGIADKAKAGCPVSKLFKADITLDATLDG